MKYAYRKIVHRYDHIPAHTRPGGKRVVLILECGHEERRKKSQAPANKVRCFQCEYRIKQNGWNDL